MNEHKKNIKNLIIDIDDTLIMYNNNGPGNLEKYKTGKPNEEEIKILNSLYNIGYRIILFTGRGWDKYEFTKNQVNSFGIKHHELIMGKPDGTIVDRDAIRSLKELL